MSKSKTPHVDKKDNKEETCSLIDTEEKKERIHFKYWAAKVLIIAITSLCVITVLTFLFLLVRNMTSVTEGAISNVLQILTDMLKLLLTPEK